MHLSKSETPLLLKFTFVTCLRIRDLSGGNNRIPDICGENSGDHSKYFSQQRTQTGSFGPGPLNPVLLNGLFEWSFERVFGAGFSALVSIEVGHLVGSFARNLS